MFRSLCCGNHIESFASEGPYQPPTDMAANLKTIANDPLVRPLSQENHPRSNSRYQDNLARVDKFPKEYLLEADGGVLEQQKRRDVYRPEGDIVQINVNKTSGPTIRQFKTPRTALSRTSSFRASSEEPAINGDTRLPGIHQQCGKSTDGPGGPLPKIKRSVSFQLP